LGDPDVVVEIILKLILKIQDLCGLDWTGSGESTVAGSYEHSNEPQKQGIPYQLSNYYVSFSRKIAPWSCFYEDDCLLRCCTV
jgi:hypothetical protein